MEYLLQPWCSTNPMCVGCKVWNTVPTGTAYNYWKEIACVEIEQQITKCKEENKACATMELPAEGQQQEVRLQV